MNKTLHKKLTGKHYYEHTQTLLFTDSEDMLAGFSQELYALREDAKDLMQPRQEAITNLMRMARTI